MRIIYFANNWTAWQILLGLKSRGEEIVGLVIHPETKQKYVDELRKAAALPEENIFDGSKLQEEETLAKLSALKPDIGLSILFDYILKPKLLNLFPKGVINLHPALLPYNRGQYPNVWSIVEGTPSGVTLHYIDESIDTGDIISQMEVQVSPADTGASLYRKLELASVELFEKSWGPIKNGTAARIKQGIKQTGDKGTYHRTQDVNQIDRIELEKNYTGAELINILRARTFPPYRGAYFEQDGKRIYLELVLKEETDKES